MDMDWLSGCARQMQPGRGIHAVRWLRRKFGVGDCGAMNCQHATLHHGHTYRCALGRFGGLPHLGTCLACQRGEEEPAETARRMSVAEERQRICGACDIADTCPLWHKTACQRMALWRRPGMSCPADRWGPAIGQLAAQ